ncbi:hypothetical protein LCGC14_1190300 [marine sediment metagenome]|uniref:Uncharacterized protein n=1 Tax=marine sediment metagenome TaxID=412755 RepID=A0A0F9LJJ6_9ZZZZ
MPEDNEKVDDFVSLWKKKIKTETGKPSAIGETLEKIKEVEEENEDLRNNIQQNIELITKTEEIIKKAIEENSRLKEEIKQTRMIGERKTADIQKENIELNNKIQSVKVNLKGKEEQLIIANHEIKELKTQTESVSRVKESPPESTSNIDSAITSKLIDDLQSDISKRKAKNRELDEKVINLIDENEQLKGEIKKLSTANINTVESPKSSVIKPIPVQTSVSTLETLCQDLQSDLNKYKRIVDKLNKEKIELQSGINGGGVQFAPKELEELKRENQKLKIELSKIEKSLKKKTEEASIKVKVDDLEKKINDLQIQLKERDHLIAELKLTSKTPISVQKGPVSGLIEDLQSKINKLKVTLEEKNKTIDELKSS